MVDPGMVILLSVVTVGVFLLYLHFSNQEDPPGPRPRIQVQSAPVRSRSRIQVQSAPVRLGSSIQYQQKLAQRQYWSCQI
jgi:hypothetical protein